jgi:lipopolysaccharide export system permease protein
MKILQRYILFELLKVFVLLLSVLTVMLVFLGVFQEAQDNGLGAVQIVQILPYIIPSLLPYTIPSTLLLAVCVVYGRLSGDLEIIATKSAGINPLSLLMPAFMLGIVLAVGSLFLTDRVIPWSVSRMQLIISQALEEIFLDQLRASHLIANNSEGYTISVVS